MISLLLLASILRCSVLLHTSASLCCRFAVSVCLVCSFALLSVSFVVLVRVVPFFLACFPVFGFVSVPCGLHYSLGLDFCYCFSLVLYRFASSLSLATLFSPFMFTCVSLARAWVFSMFCRHGVFQYVLVLLLFTPLFSLCFFSLCDKYLSLGAFRWGCTPDFLPWIFL